MKSTMIKYFLGFVLAFIVCWFLADKIVQLLGVLQNKNAKIIFASPKELFYFYGFVAFWGAFILNIPFWVTAFSNSFFAAEIKGHEKKYIAVTWMLFFTGLFVGYLFAQKMIAGFIRFGQTEEIVFMVSPFKVLEYLISRMLFSGVFFLVPLLLILFIRKTDAKTT